MLSKHQRLTKEKDFERVFLVGKSLKSGSILWRVAKKEAPGWRFGFVVSKKVSAKATVRNTVKRRLRSAVSGVLDGLAGGADVVVVALPKSAQESFAQIRQSIQTLAQPYLAKRS